MLAPNGIPIVGSRWEDRQQRQCVVTGVEDILGQGPQVEFNVDDRDVRWQGSSGLVDFLTVWYPESWILNGLPVLGSSWATSGGAPGTVSQIVPPRTTRGAYHVIVSFNDGQSTTWNALSEFYTQYRPVPPPLPAVPEQPGPSRLDILLGDDIV